MADVYKKYLDEKEQVKTYATLSKYAKKAEALLDAEEKLEKFLVKVEASLTKIPDKDNALGEVPVLVDYIRNVSQKKYTGAEEKHVMTVLETLLAFDSPVDGIPDFIPVVGYSDDIKLIEACLDLTRDELTAFLDRKK